MLTLPAHYPSLSSAERKNVRERYVVIQEGKCYYCGGDLSLKVSEKIRKLPIRIRSFPVGFFKWPIHLHHNHTTGTTIGAVHNKCNAILWQYHGE